VLPDQLPTVLKQADDGRQDFGRAITLDLHSAANRIYFRGFIPVAFSKLPNNRDQDLLNLFVGQVET
jgi:hypothetical protein